MSIVYKKIPKKDSFNKERALADFDSLLKENPEWVSLPHAHLADRLLVTTIDLDIVKTRGIRNPVTLSAFVKVQLVIPIVILRDSFKLSEKTVHFYDKLECPIIRGQEAKYIWHAIEDLKKTYE